jgi:hypothetical protein
MPTPMFDLCQSRVATNYAAETGVAPEALPPGTLAGIINILLPILLKFMGSCSSTPPGGTTPPTTGAAAVIDHCTRGSVMAHLRIRRQINQNGGLEPGMRMSAVVNTILKTGAQSTPDELQKFVEEMGE